VAELVVAAALLLVGEHLVGFGTFLEAHLRIGLGSGVGAVLAVGMVFHRQPAVGALDLVAAGRPADPKYLVIVALRHCHAESVIVCRVAFTNTTSTRRRSFVRLCRKKQTRRAILA